MQFSVMFLIQVLAFLQICVTKDVAKDNMVLIERIDEKIQQLQFEIAIIDGQYSFGLNNGSLDGRSAGLRQSSQIRNQNDRKYPKIPYEELPANKDMKIHCKLNIQNREKYTIFQTPRSSYISINKGNQFEIYNSECTLISHLKNNQVYKVLCDRGLCDDGNIVVLTTNQTLLACSEMSNFSDCSVIANLYGKISGRIVGAVVRGRGGGQVQIYVADSNGEIMVFDGQGKLRLTLSIEQDSKISHFVDIHPHPVVVSSKGWIYNFEVNKYNLVLTKCPYLFHPIHHIFVSHPYSTLIYALSSKAISAIELKSQSKGCQVAHRFSPVHQIAQLKQNEQPYIAQYQGILYIENKIISFENSSVKELSSCLSAKFNFQQMKNNYRKGFFTMSCSFEQNSTDSLLIFKQKNPQQSSNKNNTVIMIVILLLIVLLIFLFLRSTVPNLDYDQQLKYSQKMRYRTEVDEALLSAQSVQQQKQDPNRRQKERERQKQKVNENKHKSTISQRKNQ